jgi:uncharacterized protein (TIGR00290 family)
MRRKALVAWSSGKDSAFALHEARRSRDVEGEGELEREGELEFEGELEIVGLLTTLTEDYGRVSMHGVREEILDRQAQALDLPCRKVRIPRGCVNADYERAMDAAMEAARAEGIERIVFGDLFLEDVRAYRERMLEGSGIAPVFPLWGRPTSELAAEMVAAGLEARIVCLDPRKLPASFAGRAFNAAFLSDLPKDVDPCGENGEFHTCVTGGPMFRKSLDTLAGETVVRDGFVFTDLRLRSAA